MIMKFLVFSISILFLLIGADGRPIDPEVDNNGSPSAAVIAVMSVAGVVILGIAVAMCTCCGTDLLGGSPRHETLERSGWEPPSLASPGGSTLSVDIEPLPDLGQLRSTDDGKHLKPMGFYSEKPLKTDDWFSGSSSILDFPRSQFTYANSFGNGWFGQIVEGEATKLGGVARKTPVKVKLLRDDVTEQERKYFLFECNPYRDLRHPNVMQLLGKCLDTNSYLLLFEDCKLDLKAYLHKKRAVSDELIEKGELLRLSTNLSAGLSYMHEKGYIHKDFACRNCVIGADGAAKIGDYGNSIEKYKDDYVPMKGMAVPVRWIAPEIVDFTGQVPTVREPTTESDVWSFGAAFWELIEFGKQPYMELSSEDVVQKVLKDGTHRLRPLMTPIPRRDHLYQVMQMCWAQDSNQRPAMSKVHAMITYLAKNQLTGDDFESKWESVVHKTQVHGVPTDPSTVKPVAPPRAFDLSPSSSFSQINMDRQSPAPAEPTPMGANILLEPEFTVQNLNADFASQPFVEPKADESEYNEFGISEKEREEKRDFILSLSDEELSLVRSDNLVEFYEFLTKEEIDLLEKRHLRVLTEKEELLNAAKKEEEARKLEEAKKTKETAIAEEKRIAEEAKKEERKQIEEARRIAEEEAKRKAEEKAKRIAEDEAKRIAEEEAKRIAEEEAKRKAEEEANRIAEEEAKRIAEEEAKRKAEEAKRIAEEEAKRIAEEEAKRMAEEEAKKIAEEEERRIAEENARLEFEKQARMVEEETARKAVEAQRIAEEEEQRKAEARKEAEDSAKRAAEEKARRIAEEKAAEEERREAEKERIAAEEKRLAEEESNRVEEARRMAEEEEKKKAEEEAKRIAEEETLKAEEEAKRIADEEAKRIGEEETKKVEDEARRIAEEEARKIAEEEAKRIAEEETKKAEDEAKRIAEEEARKIAEEEAKKIAEEEAKRIAEEEARLKSEEEARKAAEEARRMEEEQARRLEEENAKRIAEEVKQKEEEAKRIADEAKEAAEEESKLITAEEEARISAEEEKKSTEEAKRLAEEETARAAEEAAKKKAEEAAISVTKLNSEFMEHEAEKIVVEELQNAALETAMKEEVSGPEEEAWLAELHSNAANVADEVLKHVALEEEAKDAAGIAADETIQKIDAIKELEREKILRMDPVELAVSPKEQMAEWKQHYFTEDHAQEFDELRLKRQEALEAREGILSLDPEAIGSLPRLELDTYFRFLTIAEKERIENEWKSQNSSRKSEEIEESKPLQWSPITIETPEEAKPALLKRRISADPIPPLQLSEEEANGERRTSEPFLLADTKESYEEKRQEAMSLSDEELKRMPLAELEYFYKFLSPDEILDFKSRLSTLTGWNPNQRTDSLSLTSSARSPKRAPYISELSARSKSFLTSMATSFGGSFFYDDGGFSNPFEAREQVLSGDDDFLLKAFMKDDGSGLQEFYNLLSAEEIVDLEQRVMLVKASKIAELRSSTPAELAAIPEEEMKLYLSWLPANEREEIEKSVLKQETEVTEEVPPPKEEQEDGLGSLDFQKLPDFGNYFNTAVISHSRDSSSGDIFDSQVESVRSNIASFQDAIKGAGNSGATNLMDELWNEFSPAANPSTNDQPSSSLKDLDGLMGENQTSEPPVAEDLAGSTTAPPNAQ